MDRSKNVLHFAAQGLTLAVVTYIHPSYTFAMHVEAPTFQVNRTGRSTKSSKFIKSHRYYLNHKCLSNPMDCRKFGPLFFMGTNSAEPVKIGDCLVLDVVATRKGSVGTSYLPPGWSNPLIRFFRYLADPRKTMYTLENPDVEAPDQVFQDTVVQIGSDQDGVPPLFIPTLFQTLVILVAKDYSKWIDLWRNPRHRKFKYPSFEQLSMHVYVKPRRIRLPSTEEFLLEVALWAQDPDIVVEAGTKLSQALLAAEPGEFREEAQEFVRRQMKNKKRVKAVLLHVKRLNKIV